MNTQRRTCGLSLALFAGSLLVVLPANAGPVTATSYSMENGAHGSFNYRDFTYLPCPAVDCDTTGAALSGGTGKLTDGVLPATSWFTQGELTQWVGWDSSQGLANPTVTFFFAGSVAIDSVTIWVDNTIGAGGVYLPASVSINGSSFAIAPDNVNPDPRAYTFSGLGFTGSSLNVQFFQSSSPWIMVGEVSFDDGGATGVPEPASWALLATGMAFLAVRRISARRA